MNGLVRLAAVATVFMLHVLNASAEIRLGSEWNDSLSAPPELWESVKLDNAMHTSANALSATSASKTGAVYKPRRDVGFQLYIDGSKYYVQPALFMAKEHPGEICTPAAFQKAPTYQCEEGQRYRVSCHLMFFNERFEYVGIHRFRPDEPYETYCNAVPAIGVADKAHNELLVTFQYFPIDRKAASKVSEIGDSWKRMTSLFRVKLVEGKIDVEEDDSCFGKPNAIESIPDARAALKRCGRAAR